MNQSFLLAACVDIKIVTLNALLFFRREEAKYNTDSSAQ